MLPGCPCGQGTECSMFKTHIVCCVCPWHPFLWDPLNTRRGARLQAVSARTAPADTRCSEVCARLVSCLVVAAEGLPGIIVATLLAAALPPEDC